MNNVINRFLLVGDGFMADVHLRKNHGLPIVRVYLLLKLNKEPQYLKK